ncbi:hypothetical protein ACHAXT_006188 [Thalassiosira profunda]
MGEDYSLEKCKMLAEKAASANDLPYECKKYPEAVKAANIKRSETQKQAYAGMQGGLAAQAAKKSGRETHAQIQRRLTSTRRFTKQK